MLSAQTGSARLVGMPLAGESRCLPAAPGGAWASHKRMVKRAPFTIMGL
jgi:hypothetical protein